jgi:omega-amidase
MVLDGAELIVVPGAFNMTTGPAHWKTTVRARAIDNQCYLAAASQSKNEDLSYVAYGHSLVVDPWGRVLAEAGYSEEIIYADIKRSLVNKIRKELPLLENRRTDIYS